MMRLMTGARLASRTLVDTPGIQLAGLASFQLDSDNDVAGGVGLPS